MRRLSVTLLILASSSMTVASDSMVCHKNYYGLSGVEVCEFSNGSAHITKLSGDESVVLNLNAKEWKVEKPILQQAGRKHVKEQEELRDKAEAEDVAKKEAQRKELCKDLAWTKAKDKVFLCTPEEREAAIYNFSQTEEQIKLTHQRAVFKECLASYPTAIVGSPEYKACLKKAQD
jgi:hypothetical protein